MHVSPVPGHRPHQWVWGGELACSSLILSTALPTLGDSVPMKVGIRVVQSASSLGS